MRRSAERQFDAFLAETNEFKFDFTLSRVKKALAALKNPQDSYRVIHITGSNGKGSVAAYLSSILMKSGLKTGTYTSPHLKHPSERICVSGIPVDRRKMAEQGLKLAGLCRREKIKLTYFEFLTVLAFVMFREAGVSVAVAEVGLGGRYDATNVDYRRKLLSVITSISLEHTDYLGDSLKSILEEKRMIAGRGTVVCGKMPEALKSVMRKKHGARAVFADEFCRITDVRAVPQGLYAIFRMPEGNIMLKTSMPEIVQTENLRTVLCCVDVLRKAGLAITDGCVIKGVLDARAAARFSWSGRGYYTSVAHNPAAVREMLNTVSALHPGRKLVYVFSMLADKDIKSVLKTVRKHKYVQIVLTQINNPRAIALEKLERLVVKYGIKYRMEADNCAALRLARRLKGKGVIVVGGSFYLAGRFV